MRKALAIMAMAGALTEAAKRRTPSSSPFVGEHRHAEHVDHGDGSATMRMKTKPKAAFDKYEHLYVKEGLFKNRKKPFLDRVSEFFFGPQETDAEKRLREHLEKQKFSGKSHKLGDTKTPLVNLSGAMWTGPMYMGGNTLMDVVYDTGSDWLVVEGSTCSNCEGNTYNTNDSTGNP